MASRKGGHRRMWTPSVLVVPRAGWSGLDRWPVEWRKIIIVRMNDRTGDDVAGRVWAAHLGCSPGEIEESDIRFQPCLATPFECALDRRKQEHESDDIGNEPRNRHEQARQEPDGPLT